MVHAAVNANDTDDAQCVRVAVLDTGVHAEHPLIKTEIGGRIRCSKGFPDEFNPLIDQSGHGTYVTSVLLRTAPQAILYIARVVDDREQLHADNEYSAAANVSGHSF